MKRLVIIAEGQTEREFVNTILRPHLSSNGILDVVSFVIKKSGGGLSSYNDIKPDIVNTIYESNVVVTTMIDYYALPTDFPSYSECQSITNKTARIKELEKAILKDVESTQGREFPNFLPYIQLHEFESLTFTSSVGFEHLWDENEYNYQEINNIIRRNPNPETINDNPNSAPSKRLINLIPGYEKIVDGNLIIDEIGIEKVIKSNPHFSEWVSSIIESMI